MAKRTTPKARKGSEWLVGLPRHIQNQILPAMKAQGREEYLNREHNNIADFVTYSLNWERSPQGDAYWRSIYIMLCDTSKPHDYSKTYEEYPELSAGRDEVINNYSIF